MNPSKRLLNAVLDACEGKTRAQVKAALPQYTATSIETAISDLRRKKRMRIAGYAEQRPGFSRREGIYSATPGPDAPYPTKWVKPAPREYQPPPPPLPIPASIFHLGFILNVDRKGWIAANESFRRRA